MSGIPPEQVLIHSLTVLTACNRMNVVAFLGWNTMLRHRYNALGWQRTTFCKQGVWVNATGEMCGAGPRKQREMKEVFGFLPCPCLCLICLDNGSQWLTGNDTLTQP